MFVCVKNGGKSQMAAGLMRHLAGDQVHVDSAGTRPAGHLNAASVASLQEVGIDITARVEDLAQRLGVRPNERPSPPES